VAGRNRWPLCRECLSPIPPAPVAGRGGCRLLRERISRSHVPFRHLLPQRWLCCGPDVPPSAACHRAGRPSGRFTLPGSPQVLGRRKGPGPGRSPLSAPGRSPPSHETPHISTRRSGRADRLSGRAGGLSSPPAPQGPHQGVHPAFRRASRWTACGKPCALHSATRGADAETARFPFRNAKRPAPRGEPRCVPLCPPTVMGGHSVSPGLSPGRFRTSGWGRCPRRRAGGCPTSRGRAR
jgi:hypothetical protein